MLNPIVLRVPLGDGMKMKYLMRSYTHFFDLCAIVCNDNLLME